MALRLEATLPGPISRRMPKRQEVIVSEAHPRNTDLQMKILPEGSQALINTMLQ
jgi:hypothetical protein